MSSLIQNKMNQVLGDIARPTKFKCQIYPPEEVKFGLSLKGQANNATQSIGSLQAAEYIDYFCHASSFPGMSVTVNEYAYQGRKIPVVAVSEFSQKWSATFYNDEQHSIRKFFYDWMTYHQTSRYDGTGGKLKNQFPTLHIYQLDFALSRDVVVYSLYNIYPTNLNDISVSYSDINNLETFEVEFTFSHFDINKIDRNGLTSEEVMEKITGTIQGIAQSVTGGIMNKVKDISSGIFDDYIKPVVNDIFKSPKGAYIG